MDKKSKTCCIIDCNKKITPFEILSGVSKCKCGKSFCSFHKMPEDHNCTFDFKTYDRERLEKVKESRAPKYIETRK